MKIVFFTTISKKLIAGICITVGILIIIASFLLSNYVISANLVEKNYLPIYSVETKEKKVAITFDSTWGVNNTVEILDILDKEEVKATFFLLGKWIDEFPEETKEIYKRGNEIGNHSYSHPSMSNISEERLIKEIASGDEKLKKTIGTSTKLFRFPSGEYNTALVQVVERTKHIAIQWDVDSIDWKEQGADIEFNRVIKNVKPGSIVLFHNGAKYTTETLPKVIEKLKREGYSFVTVSELIYKDNYSIDHKGVQKINN